MSASRPLTPERSKAAGDKLVGLAKTKDPSVSFAYLRGAIERDASLARACHPLLHELGHAAYARYKDFAKTISYEKGLCNSGYTHGAIEMHFLAAGDDIRTTLRTTCARDFDTMFEEWQCFHGVGHGLMYVTNKDLTKALAMCQELDSEFATSACQNGVFMDRFIVIDHTGAPIDAAGIDTRLCRRQEDHFKAQCYLYAPTAYLTHHANSYGAAFSDCKANAEMGYRTACMHGVGSQASKDNITRPRIARNVCRRAPNGFASACIEGAISILVNHYASVKPVEPLCKTTFSEYRQLCEAVIKLKKPWFDL
jgi:hypothetical protein